MYRGSCLCGQVGYQIDGPVKRSSHCYCTMCQKQHGAAFGSYAIVAAAHFSYVSGADAVAFYPSSPGVERCFCKVCGSSLTWRTAAQPDIIAVTLGTFDTPYEQVVHREVNRDSRPGWLGA